VEEGLFQAQPGDLLGPLAAESGVWLLLVHGFEEARTFPELLPQIRRQARRQVLQGLRDAAGFELVR
jgi:hypothetical protein